MDLPSTVHQDYYFTGVAGVTSHNDIITGRPAEGLAILWHKDIAQNISLTKTNHKRLSSISLKKCTNDSVCITCISVYMPCDNR